MDNNEATTEVAEVTLIAYEQPTAGDIAKQALIATGVSLLGTALVYGAAYGAVTVYGKISNAVTNRRARKALAKTTQETDEES
jgi:predicted DNA repair protein MutK